MRNAVIGQTGRGTLSDDTLFHKQSAKRTVRYRHTKIRIKGHVYYRTDVVGPFHSRLYGVSVIRTKKSRSKAALQDLLARSYGYFGRIMLSDVDDADVIGLSPLELWRRSNKVERELLQIQAPGPVAQVSV